MENIIQRNLKERLMEIIIQKIGKEKQMENIIQRNLKERLMEITIRRTGREKRMEIIIQNFIQENLTDLINHKICTQRGYCDIKVIGKLDTYSNDQF
ncbi:hypothetical protein [Chryseobacterium indoltheticum]|uniref:hypothetical protein n=1 Tax=Chryseobacterium indoltheticum TaxID=254 RepID=UPI0011C075E0|nr:hypothetical protein [Chryseobacterium indoltheticum]